MTPEDEERNFERMAEDGRIKPLYKVVDGRKVYAIPDREARLVIYREQLVNGAER